jgi:hypothetical protein
MAADHSHGESATAHSEHEKPEDWGWHHEFVRARQVMGWFSVLVLALYLTATHYNRTGTVALILAILLLAGGLIYDRQRRKTQWRH